MELRSRIWRQLDLAAHQAGIAVVGSRLTWEQGCLPMQIEERQPARGQGPKQLVPVIRMRSGLARALAVVLALLGQLGLPL